MRTRLSRWLVGLGALLALASFVLAEPLGSRLGAVAIGCAMLAVLVWRGWRPEARDEAVPATVLDDATLAEVQARLQRACAPGTTLDDALRAVVRTLATELGARQARATRVHKVAGRPRLTTLLDLATPGTRRGAPRSAQAVATAAVSPLQRVLETGGVVIDPPHGHAIAVPGRAGGVVAVIDFESLELEVEAAALQRVLVAVQRAFADAALQSSSPAAPWPGFNGSAEDLGFLASINADREVGIFVLEPQHLRLVGVSRRAERDFGVRRQRVLGKTVGQAFGPPIEHALDGALRSVLAGTQTVEQTLTWSSSRGQRGAHVSLCAVRRSDGAARWITGMARVLRADAALRPERRTMPRHGLLVDDAVSHVAAPLARPTVSSNRGGDAS